jgi:regulator of replication initiation timing
MFSRWRKHAGRLRDRNIALTRENLRLRQLLEERAKPSLKRRTKVKAAKQDADS